MATQQQTPTKGHGKHTHTRADKLCLHLSHHDDCEKRIDPLLLALSLSIVLASVVQRCPCEHLLLVPVLLVVSFSGCPVNARDQGRCSKAAGGVPLNITKRHETVVFTVSLGDCIQQARV